MRKILTTVLIYICAAMLLSQNVYAAQADVIQSFSTGANDAKIYLRPSSDFNWTDKSVNPISDTEATVDGEEALAVTRLALESPVSFMFIVDKTILPVNVDAESIAYFVDDFMGKFDPKYKPNFALYAMGDNSYVVCGFTDDTSEISEEINNITEYKDKGNYFNKSLLDAIDYYKSHEAYTDGYAGIIIISDGIQSGKKEVTDEEALKAIKDTHLNVFTIGFEALSSRSDSGLEFMQKIAEETNAEHFLLTKENGKIYDGLKSLLCTDIRSEQGIKSEGSNAQISYFEGGQTTPVLTLNTQIGKRAEVVASAGDSAEGSTVLQQGTDEYAESSSGGGGASVTAAKKSGSIMDYLLYIVLGALIVILLILIVVVLIKKKGTRAASAPSTFEYSKKNPRGTADIGISIDVISGRLVSKKMNFDVSDNIFIGRSRDCQICFDDPNVSKFNSKIFYRDGIMYIEDLGSTNGTAISGMKIGSINKLTSGDVVSIGDVRFSVHF